jgi:RNA polymerase sigma-70 factor (ECF subfamily)
LNTTSVSLLERLRQPGEAEAWARLVELYTPLLYSWACRMGLQDQDAADLVQDVFAVLVQKLPEFLYDRQRSFRGWLRTILLNKWRDQRRRAPVFPCGHDEPVLANLPGPDELDGLLESEYRQKLVGRALELMQAQFQPTTWKACWETAVAGRPATAVARELGMTVDAVYAAKSRVLRALRQQLQGLLE